MVEPRMSHDRVAVQTGSAALTICVNDTAPAPAHGGRDVWEGHASFIYRVNPIYI